MGWAMRVGQGWRLSCGCDVLVTDEEGVVWRVVERGRGCVVGHAGEVVPGALEAPSSSPWRIVSMPDGGRVSEPERGRAAACVCGWHTERDDDATASQLAYVTHRLLGCPVEPPQPSAGTAWVLMLAQAVELLRVRVVELERPPSVAGPGCECEWWRGADHREGCPWAQPSGIVETSSPAVAVDHPGIADRVAPAVAEQRYTGEPARLRPVCTCGAAYRVGSSAAVVPTMHRRSCPVRAWRRAGGAS